MIEMDTLEQELERVKKYVTCGGRGVLKSASLIETVRAIDGIGRIYDTCIEPSKEWHDHFNVLPMAELWVVAFEHTCGGFDGAPATLCTFGKQQCPLPKEAYDQYREIIE